MGEETASGLKAFCDRQRFLCRDSDAIPLRSEIIRRVSQLLVAFPLVEYRGLNVSRNLLEAVVVSSQIRTAAHIFQQTTKLLLTGTSYKEQYEEYIEIKSRYSF